MVTKDKTSGSESSLLAQHREAAATPVEKAGIVIDHLVDAMAGEPSAPLRRVLTFVDIARNPGTSQQAILTRIDSDKSTVARDIDWLYNYGCIMRNQGENSAREVSLTVHGVAKTHLGYAIKLMENDLSRLQKFLEDYIKIFQGYRGTLRDAKIITVMAIKGDASKNEILDALYNGPSTTDNRTLMTLVEQGFLSNNENG